MAQAVLEVCGGMCHPKHAGFVKLGAKWEVEVGRKERGVVVEGQVCLFVLSSELGSAPGMSQFPPLPQHISG